MVWGSPVDGEVFDVPDGYAHQLEEAGLAERLVPVAAPAPAASEPEPDASEPEPDASEPEAPTASEPEADDDLDAAIASLQARPLTNDNATVSRRGRRRK
jgi:hypothetical protein